jgi:hypothetical protein
VKEIKKSSIIDLQARYNQEMKQKAKFKSSVLKKRRKKGEKLKEIKKFNNDYTFIHNTSSNYIPQFQILKNQALRLLIGFDSSMIELCY